MLQRLAMIAGVIVPALMLNGCTKCGPIRDDWLAQPKVFLPQGAWRRRPSGDMFLVRKELAANSNFLSGAPQVRYRNFKFKSRYSKTCIC